MDEHDMPVGIDEFASHDVSESKGFGKITRFERLCLLVVLWVTVERCTNRRLDCIKQRHVLMLRDDR